MRRVTLLVVLSALLVVFAAETAYAVTYSRLVVFNATLQAGGLYVFKVPSVVLNGYSTVYMSTAQDCSAPEPTMAFFGQTYSLIVFRPTVSSSSFYLCYGYSIYYPPQLFTAVSTGVLTVTASSSLEYVSGSINRWYYSSGSGSVVIYDFGRMVHVADANVTVYVPAFYSLTFTLCGSTYTVSGSTVTIRGGGCDNTSLTLLVSGTGYFYVSTYSIDYYPYVFNETNVTVSGYNTWLIHVAGSDWWAASGSSNTSATAYADVYMAYTPAGSVAWTTASQLDVPGVSSLNATIAAWIYNWTGTNSVAYEVDAANTTLANITLISAATLVTTTGAGTATSNTSISVTLDVSEPIYTATATVLAAAAIAAAVSVIFRFYKWRAMEMLAATALSISLYITSIVLYIKTGNITAAKTTIILMLATSTIDIAAMLYRELPRIL